MENETHNVLWDFEKQTDHQIPTKKLDLMMINKKRRRCRIMNFAVRADHRAKTEENEKETSTLTLPEN